MTKFLLLGSAAVHLWCAYTINRLQRSLRVCQMIVRMQIHRQHDRGRHAREGGRR